MEQNENQYTESLQAVKEIAKATGQGLSIVQKFGEFVSRYIGGSLEQGFGIVEDKLKYLRWERHTRLMDRACVFLEERGDQMMFNPVPMNVAIPIFQAASLEEDDDLQDLWARLLVNAADANSGIQVRRGLVSILQDFGKMEAQLLQAIHDSTSMNGVVPTKGLPDDYLQPEEEETEANQGLPPDPVQIGLWNLMRLGCVASAGTWDSMTGIKRVQITALGKALVNACSASPKTG